LIRSVLEDEQDSGVRDALLVALAQIDLLGDDPERRTAAVENLGRLGDRNHRTQLEGVLKTNEDGSPLEADEDLRVAAKQALARIDRRAFFVDLAGNFFYGLSLASILLLAALGLAITFGLMGVINMAHGEMLMLGAYTTYTVLGLFKSYLPNLLDAYILAAIPAAFVVCGCIGMAMERGVIRFLYGRPLETLLATWGISLILIQTVRLLFGAQNVEVANPEWLSGGYEIFRGVVLPWSRIFIVLFAGFTVTVVWLALQRTPLGLHIRAVTQNREMAASLGIATSRVDMWTFGLGSAIAGLGGVALSQIGNVGPELGQSYIVDSFMVVVLGGVGKLAGTVVAALGLGVVNKFLEPVSGAVLGKIFVLGFLILFIQRRPQGIFALKGRAAEI
ncbi:MAG: urea ABC transporter permease subunit UrtB, partial [Myxococcota bacterium]